MKPKIDRFHSLVNDMRAVVQGEKSAPKDAAKISSSSAKALARGKIACATEPRAAKVRYDRKLDRIIVDLTNGCTFSFPPRLAQGLETATGDQLMLVEILGHGYGLHWNALDVDLSIPGLLSGIFGTGSHMARLANQAKSPAKAAASCVNGAKGGRPRKAVRA